MTPIMKYFSYDHLPEGPMKEVSQGICNMAKAIDETIPGSPEKSAGLRKLLEAKDCLVRAVMPE